MLRTASLAIAFVSLRTDRDLPDSVIFSAAALAERFSASRTLAGGSFAFVAATRACLAASTTTSTAASVLTSDGIDRTASSVEARLRYASNARSQAEVARVLSPNFLIHPRYLAMVCNV